MQGIERTLVLLKPDTVKRQIAGEIIARFERVGLKIVAMKLIWSTSEQAGEHYGEDIVARRGEAVRKRLMQFLSIGPVVAMVLEGVEAIENVRMMVGETEPKKAAPGTIRGDYSHVSYRRADFKDRAVENLIHASANPEDAQREIHIWFSDSELYDYKTVHEPHTLCT